MVKKDIRSKIMSNMKTNLLEKFKANKKAEPPKTDPNIIKNPQSEVAQSKEGSDQLTKQPSLSIAEIENQLNAITAGDKAPEVVAPEPEQKKKKKIVKPKKTKKAKKK